MLRRSQVAIVGGMQDVFLVSHGALRGIQAHGWMSSLLRLRAGSGECWMATVTQDGARVHYGGN